jgi:hypothetical protein
VSAAKEEGEGSKEFGFLDAKVFKQSDVPNSFLPIEVKYS